MSLQAQRGYVYDGTVMEAVWALHLICLRLVLDVPAGSTNDLIMAYSKQRAEAFANLIADVEVAVTTAQVNSLGSTSLAGRLSLS